MGLFDMKKLKDAVQSATVTAASTVRDAADAAATAAGEGKLPDVKLPEVKLPDVKLPERVTNLVDRARPDATTTDVPEQGLSGRDALSVFIT